MSDRAAIKRFQTEVAAAHGDVVHLIFNNAGIVVQAAWDMMSEATHDKVRQHPTHTYHCSTAPHTP